MINARILIAAGVVGVMLVLVVFAYVANGLGQWHQTHTYEPPNSLIDLFHAAMTAALTVLTLGGIGEWRSTIEKMIEAKKQKEGGDNATK